MGKYILALSLIVWLPLIAEAQLTWEQKAGPYGGIIETIEIAPDGDLYALTQNNGNIYRSSDNGLNWTIASKPGGENFESIHDIKIIPDGTIYAVTGQSNFYSSIDDGTSWTKLNTGTNSLDGGFDFANEIEFNAATNELVMMGYADPNPVVYISSDGGITWNVGGIISTSVDHLAVSSFGEFGMIFVYGCCGSARVYASDDGGFTFNEFMSGLSDPVIIDMAIGPNGEDTWLVNRHGVYKWDHLDAIPTDDWESYTADLPVINGQSIVLAATESSTGDDFLFLGDNESNILYRMDLTIAPSWVAQNTAFAVNESEAFDLAAKSNTSLFVAAGSIGVFRSTNGGASWADANKGIKDMRFNDIIRSDGTIIVAAEQHIYTSSNEGATWTRSDLDGTSNVKSVSNFVKLDNGDIYGYGTVSVFSNNDGADWDPIVDPFPVPNHPRKVVNSDQSRFWALGYIDNEIVFSDNNGTSWSSPIPLTISTNNYTIENIYADGNHNLYANIRDFENGGHHFLYKITFNPNPGTGTPTNGTATLIDTSVPGYTIEEELNTIVYQSGKLYVLGRDSDFEWQLCISSDGGASFTSHLLDDGGRRLFVTPNGYLFLYQSQGDVHQFAVSHDDGETFQTSIVGDAFKGEIRAITVDELSGVAYTMIDYAGLFHTTSTIIVPETPINITEVGRGAHGLTFRFEDNSEFEDGFVIEKLIGGVYDTIQITSSNGGTGAKRYVRERFLESNTVYNYRVSAYNNAGSSGYAQISITTLNETTPSIPDNRSWSGVTENIDGLGTFGPKSPIVIKHIGNGRYSISDVTAGALDNNPPIDEDPDIPGFFYEAEGQTYLEMFEGPLHEEQNGIWDQPNNTITLFWRLDPLAGLSYPDAIEQITLTLNANDPIPGPPTDVAAYVYSSTEIEVQWTGTAFEEEFLIERSTSPGGPFTQVGSAVYPATTFLDNTSLTLNTTYYYRVIGSNSSGLSAPSTESSGVIFTLPKFTLSNSAVSTESRGSGTNFIWADFDNDGDEDAILIELTFFGTGTTIPFAFRNDGGGVFAAIDAGLEAAPHIVGSAADYDNDGNVDLFLSTTGESNFLYKGNGDFTFTKVDPHPFGQNPPDADIDNSSLSQAWVDVNNDGRLDFFISNQSRDNDLFLQDLTGAFTEVTTGELVTYEGRTNIQAWADYDNDGDMDVFHIDNSSVTSPNRLFRNNGDETFTRVTGLEFDTDLDLEAFGASWADYDNDSDLDLFLAIQSDGGPTGNGENVLYRNSGAGGNYAFNKVSASPVTDPKNYQTFGSAWGDIDNDGDLDLLTGSSLFESANEATPNGIFLNNGNGSFTQVTNEKFNDGSLTNFGLSLVDYDQDGFLDVSAATLDLLSLQLGGEGVNSLLFKNNHTPSASRNWVQLKLIGTLSNRSAIGARITLVAGGKTQIREITTTGGFANGSSLIAHFGLGSSTSITSIQIRWPSGLVQNLPALAINQIHTINEDGTGPVGVTFSPANNENDVASNTTISITLNEPATAIAGKSLLLYLHSDLATAIDGVDLADAVTSDNLTYTFTLPQKLLASTQYNISVDAGAFVDQFGNESLEFPTGLWTFTTGAGPAISTLSPAHNATAVATDAALQITFDEPPIPAAAKNIHVFNGATEILNLAVLSNGTVTGNVYEIPAPAEGWPFNTLLEVTIDAGAFTDTDANDFAGIVSGAWSFTTVEEADTEPPVITFTVPGSPSKGFENATAPITVTDNKQVSAVVVSIRKISGSAYTDLPATLGSNANIYSVSLSEASHFDEMGTEFYITATDISGNTTRSPDGTSTHKVYLTYSDTQSKIPATNIGVGGKAANWKVFSIPFELGTNNSVQSVFDELTQSPDLTNKKDYMLITYKDQSSWAQYPEELQVFERGKGYFINILNAFSTDIKIGNLTAPANSRSNLFQMDLKQGWNMIGNPYLSAISWDNVVSLNASLSGTTAAQLKKFSSGTYVNDQNLAAYDGGFVLSDIDRTISIPFLNQISSGGRNGFHDLGTDLQADTWALSFSINQAEINYELGGIGMANEASLSFDIYDDVTPPRFFDYLELNFSHPEHFAKRFTRDIVPTQNQYTWEFSVASNLEGMAELHWNNVPLRNSGRELFLLDIAGQKLVNMKETGSYLFDPKESSNFKIYFGENLNITPERVQLGNAYPNPTTGYTKIAFSLPETGGLNQNVSLDIMDAMGRTVGTITQGRFNPGYHETNFDARELTNGFYTYRLTVQSKNGRTMEVNKLIIK